MPGAMRSERASKCVCSRIEADRRLVRPRLQETNSVGFLYTHFVPIVGGDRAFTFRSVVQGEEPVGEIVRPKKYFPAVAHGVKRDPVVGVVVPDAAEGVPAGFVVDQLDLLALFGG